MWYNVIWHGIDIVLDYVRGGMLCYMEGPHNREVYIGFGFYGMVRYGRYGILPCTG